MIEVRRAEVFTTWLDALRDQQAKARIRIMAFGRFGHHKAAGGHGVQELRVDRGPRQSRYYVQRGKLLVVPLCGGDECTQRKDMSAAQKLAASL